MLLLLLLKLGIKQNHMSLNYSHQKSPNGACSEPLTVKGLGDVFLLEASVSSSVKSGQ